MAAEPIRVLFVCAGNSARSIIAESLLNALGGGRFRGYSAGLHPARFVDPLAIEVLSRQGYPVRGVRTKHWREFQQADAPRIDFVMMLCEDAARESRPPLRGDPMESNWWVDDPARTPGGREERLRAFDGTLAVLRRRLQQFTGLPFESTGVRALRAPLEEIGRL